MFMTASPHNPLFTTTRGEDALFMTARQDLFVSAATIQAKEPTFTTAGPYPISTQGGVELQAGHADESSPGSKGNGNSPTCTDKVPVESNAKGDQTPNSLEGSLQMTLTSAVSPSASIEMGLTLTKLLRQRHLIESAPEHSVLSSWSSSIVQENHFLPEVCDNVMCYIYSRASIIGPRLSSPDLWCLAIKRYLIT